MNEKNMKNGSADSEAMSLDELDQFAGGIGRPDLDGEKPQVFTISRNLIEKMNEKKNNIITD